MVKKSMQKHEQWLLYAKEDLQASNVALLPEYMMVRTAYYHAQQCAEKALKGYIAYKKEEPPKTHDLVKLLKLCSKYNQDFLVLNTDVYDINPFSVASRYPEDAYMLPDSDHAKLIIDLSSKIFNFVSEQISLGK